MKRGPYKLAIVLHVYYIDRWSYFENKLKQLKTDFDLYVTLCENNVDISNDIKKAFPKATIYKYPNKGLDIGPFIRTIKRLRDKDYDYLIKIHTKTIGENAAKNNILKQKGHNTDTSRQVDNMINDLISSDDIIQRNIELIRSDNVRMYGTRVISTDHHKFVPGTMFLVDYKVLRDILSDELLDVWYSKMPEVYSAGGTFTHLVERLLGQKIVDAGYDIVSRKCKK